MRGTLLLLVAALVTGAAHAQTPDPIEPARYYPLAVGNVWEYRDRYWPNTTVISRREIVRDTVFNGQTYWVASFRESRDGGPLGVPFLELPIRFDPETSRLVFNQCSGDLLSNPSFCSFAAPIGLNQTCEGYAIDVRWGLDQTVILSDGTHIAVVALKDYQASGGGFRELYAADVGYIYYFGPDHGDTHWLRYARIGGVEYGTPFAVSAEAPAPDARLELNTRGRRLVLTAHDAAPVRVDLFDTLGRHVATLHDARLDGERVLDLPALSAGLYIARAIQGAARASVRVVVAR